MSVPSRREPSARPRASRPWRVGILLVGVLLATVLAVLTARRPVLLVNLENLGYDLQLRAAHRTALPSETVTIVDVDERSLDVIGQWPWPRHLVARLIGSLREAGARSIGVDFLFAEPDRQSVVHLRDAIQRDFGVQIGLSGMPAESLDNDLTLAHELAAPGVVSSVWFEFDAAGGRDTPPAPTIQILVQRERGAPEGVPVPDATGVVSLTPVLADAAKTVGFLNALPDFDGKIRRMPLVIACGGNLYPSLSLATVLCAEHITTVRLKTNAAGARSVCFGDTVVPVDRQGNMLLPFGARGQDQFDYVPALDVLEGRASAGRIRNRLVFLGSSAIGHKDIHATPLERVLPGVQLHALAADTMLRGGFLQSPAWSAGLQFVLVLGLCLAVTVFLARYSLLTCFVFTGGSLAVLWFGAHTALVSRGVYISPVAPMLAVTASFVLLGLIRFRREERLAIQRARQLATAQDCAILGLVSIAETRDPETGRHIIRTQHYVRLLAEHLANHPRFRHELQPEHCEAIVKGAPLHDIGKVGVPDNILLKPGPLTEAERETMKSHSALGHEALARAERLAGLDGGLSFLQCAKEIARSHHERWDGAGYPDGLRADTIPVSARLMALADVYDALRSARPYKPGFSHENATEILLAGSGTQLDPDVVQAFVELDAEFQRIAAQYADNANP